MHRREILKMAGALAMTSLPAVPLRAQTRSQKKIIVAGGGIGGLCCGYELMKRGHEVVVLEASGRTGGHVRTIHDPLADGLYADVGAEHFTKPSYDLYWGYVREFNLTPLYALNTLFALIGVLIYIIRFAPKIMRVNWLGHTSGKCPETSTVFALKAAHLPPILHSGTCVSWKSRSTPCILEWDGGNKNTRAALE